MILRAYESMFIYDVADAYFYIINIIYFKQERKKKNNSQDLAVTQRFLPTDINGIWLNNWVASNQEATSCNIT